MYSATWATREARGTSSPSSSPGQPRPSQRSYAEPIASTTSSEQRELLRHRAGDRGVVGDHPVDLAVPREREREAEPEPVQRRAPGAELPHSRRRHPQAPRVVVVLARLEGDVVAEPLGLLVGVRVAADIDEKSGVVDDRPLLLVEAETLGEPQRDQALPQHVLHRLPEAEVDAERERGNELRQSGPARDRSRRPLAVPSVTNDRAIAADRAPPG